jgi:hypothetical protein
MGKLRSGCNLPKVKHFLDSLPVLYALAGWQEWTTWVWAGFFWEVITYEFWALKPLQLDQGGEQVTYN